MMQNSTKKRALTLIELIVVIALIATISSGVVLNVRKYFIKSQVVFDRQRLESLIKMTRAYAIISETDWDLEFMMESGVTKLIWRCPEDPEKKSIFSKTALAAGTKIFFKDEKAPISRISFFASGWVFPLGDLRIENDQREMSISLKNSLELSVNSASSIEEILEKR